MWQQHSRRALRQARRRAKTQQRALLDLEVAGVVAVTLHSAFTTLTIAVVPEVGGQLADTLREALRERRRAWRTKLHALRDSLGRPLSATSSPAAGQPANRPDPPPES